MNLRLALALICLTPALHAAPPKELVSLQQSYAFAVTERVTAPHETALTALNTKFTAALDNAATQAKSAGDLPAVLAIQADKKLLTEKQPLPADDEKTPESLKKLRAIYRDQLAKLDEQRTANTAALLAPYTAKLQELEATLTKTDRIAEAKEVMDYRQGLKADAPVPQAAMATTAPASTTSQTAPAAAQASKVKGDDRKAAEWVLSVGGAVEIWENDTSSRRINVSTDLPKGKFSLRSVLLDNNNETFKPITDADFQNLAGLQRLEMVMTNKLSITPAAFDVLATCPAINRLTMQYNRLGDDLWPHLAGLKQLKTLAQGYDYLPVQGIGFSHLNQPSLSELSLGKCPIVDEALKELGKFNQLRSLNLESTKITDAGMGALSSLKQLNLLNVRGTNVTAAGLAALKGAPITNLGYGISMDDFTSQAPQVAALFPKLEKLSLPRDGKHSPEDWPKIAQAMPQVKELTLWSTSFTDASCEGIDAMPALEGLDLTYAQLTDAGIVHLSRVKKLRWLKIKDAKLTDTGLDTLAGMKKLQSVALPKPGNGLTTEGIAKLKKQRPDLKVD